jgi:hypothetical protein
MDCAGQAFNCPYEAFDVSAVQRRFSTHGVTLLRVDGRPLRAVKEPSETA